MCPIKKLAWDLDEWYWKKLVQSKEEIIFDFNPKLGDADWLDTKERKLLQCYEN
jgi:hypothetical protein